MIRRKGNSSAEIFIQGDDLCERPGFRVKEVDLELQTLPDCILRAEHNEMNRI